MLKKLRIITVSLLLAFALFADMNINSKAAQAPVDPDKTGSITLTIKGEEEARSSAAGTTFTIYQAGVLHKDGERETWELTSDFSDSGVSLADLTDTTLASTLTDYAKKQSLSGRETETVDEDGSVKFDDLSPGIYLLVCSDTASVAIEPFLVSVPIENPDKTGWIYDIDATPKPEVKVKRKISVKKVWKDGDTTGRPSSVTVTLYKDTDAVGKAELSELNNWSYTWTNLGSGQYRVEEEVPSGFTVEYSEESDANGDASFTVTNTMTTEDETPSSPTNSSGSSGGSGSSVSSGSTGSSSKLAQTGQLNWPVPVLAGSGVLLFLIGWGMLFLKKKK